MGNPLTNAAYIQLLEEDLVWLEAQPKTCERDHLAVLLQRVILDVKAGGHAQGDRGRLLAGLKALLDPRFNEPDTRAGFVEGLLHEASC